MSRGRGDPSRIYEAAREGVRQRLMQSERISDRHAEQLLSSWEMHAALSGIDRLASGFWDQAATWIWDELNASGSGHD